MLWVYNFSNLCGSESRIGNGEQNEVVFKKACEVWIGLQQGCVLLKGLDGLGCNRDAFEAFRPC